MKSLLLVSSLLLGAASARAEGPVGPPQGGDPVDEIKKAAAKITKSMKESEEALTRVARGETAEPKGVDVALPPPETGPKSSSSSSGGAGGGGGGGEALRGSGEQGREVVEGINRIIENAAKLGGSSGGGGGGKSGKSEEESDTKDGEKQRNEKKGQDEKKDPLKDNDPKGGDPESGKKQKDPKANEEPKGKAPPPPSPAGKPGPKDPSGIFFAQLPAKVREAVLAGDFDQVPERYRDLIREWTKKLAEKEAAEAAK